MRKTVRAIIIEDNKLLVFFRRKLKDNKYITYYALPGGHVEDSESYEETVIRELKEEMNLDIEIVKYLGKLEAYNQIEYYYSAKIVGGELVFGGEELERNNYDNYYEIRWIDIDEAMNSNITAIEFIKRVVEENED